MNGYHYDYLPQDGHKEVSSDYAVGEYFLLEARALSKVKPLPAWPVIVEHCPWSRLFQAYSTTSRLHLIHS